MSSFLNTIPPELIGKYSMAELEQIKNAVTYLYDGYTPAITPLSYIFHNFEEWVAMFLWLKTNQITGKKVVEFFQNESPEDGGGYLLGCTTILNHIDGKKNFQDAIKVDRLKK